MSDETLVRRSEAAGLDVREFRSLIQDVDRGNDFRALRRAARLEVLLSWVIDALMRACRTKGYTWAEIGDALGCSRQAAMQRAARGVPEGARIRGRRLLNQQSPVSIVDDDDESA